MSRPAGRDRRLATTEKESRAAFVTYERVRNAQW